MTHLTLTKIVKSAERVFCVVVEFAHGLCRLRQKMFRHEVQSFFSPLQNRSENPFQMVWHGGAVLLMKVRLIRHEPENPFLLCRIHHRIDQTQKI